jgi:chromate reductase, NAD(P)H dehydrogenase (quinone)
VAVKRLEWRGKEIEPAVRLREAPILVISGSLRRDSINSAVARAAAVAAARDDLAFTIDDSPRALPHFNPGFRAFPSGGGAPLPPGLRRCQSRLARCAGVHVGIPRAFKNALDWLVGSSSPYRKPIAVLHTAPPGRGAHVREALTHVLRAHNAVVTHHRLPIPRHDRPRAVRSPTSESSENSVLS